MESQLRKVLQCPVTLERYSTEGPNKPYVLACGHTVSKMAIERALTEGGICPLDKTPITAASVEDFHPNHKLLELMEELQASKKKAFRLPDDSLTCEQSLANLLGTGGSASVYRGWLKADGGEDEDEVAVKVFPLFGADDKLIAWVQKELHTMCTVTKKVSGAAIEFKGFVERPGRDVCMVMELAEGSLLDLMRGYPNAQLPPAKWLEIALQLSGAVKALHVFGIIHRDISARNVMRAQDGTFKLADFGISHVCTATAHVTNRSAPGNPWYMAPEQSDHTARLTTSVDVWGFAATMMHAWTGKVPYDGLSPLQIMRTQGMQEVGPDVASTDMPEGLKDVMAACFAFDPTARPTMAVINARLRRLKSALRSRPGSRTTCTIATSSVQSVMSSLGVLGQDSSGLQDSSVISLSMSIEKRGGGRKGEAPAAASSSSGSTVAAVASSAPGDLMTNLSAIEASRAVEASPTIMELTSLPMRVAHAGFTSDFTAYTESPHASRLLHSAPEVEADRKSWKWFPGATLSHLCEEMSEGEHSLQSSAARRIDLGGHTLGDTTTSAASPGPCAVLCFNGRTSAHRGAVHEWKSSEGGEPRLRLAVGTVTITNGVLCVPNNTQLLLEGGAEGLVLQDLSIIGEGVTIVCTGNVRLETTTLVGCTLVVVDAGKVQLSGCEIRRTPLALLATGPGSAAALRSCRICGCGDGVAAADGAALTLLCCELHATEGSVAEASGAGTQLVVQGSTLRAARSKGEGSDLDCTGVDVHSGAEALLQGCEFPEGEVGVMVAGEASSVVGNGCTFGPLRLAGVVVAHGALGEFAACSLEACEWGFRAAGPETRLQMSTTSAAGCRAGGVLVTEGAHVSLTHCTMGGSSHGAGIRVAGVGSHLAAVDSVMSNNDSHGLVVCNAAHAVVHHSELHASRAAGGAFVSGEGTEVEMFASSLVGNAESGAVVEEGALVTLSECALRRGGRGHGLSVTGKGTRVGVDGCTLSDNAGSGVWASGGRPSVKLHRCCLELNASCGVFVEDASASVYEGESVGNGKCGYACKRGAHMQLFRCRSKDEQPYHASGAIHTKLSREECVPP